MRTAAAAVGAGLAVAVLAGTSGAVAASGPGAPAVAHAAAITTGYQVKGQLYGVAATSPRNAWAVGMRLSPGAVPMTLLLHWNGTKWAEVTSPKPVPGKLSAVTATSADNAWAVGQTGTPKGYTTSYALHWNGKAWSVQQCPVPVRYAYYTAVAASGSDAWITGVSTGQTDVTPPGTIALHRTGGTWQSTAVPGAVQYVLRGVAFSGKTAAWAVGAYGRSGIIMHWTGMQWKVAGRLFDSLPEAVTSGPWGHAWLVGRNPATDNGGAGISQHWNGKTWSWVAVPHETGSMLHGVAYFPGGTVWAVGYWWPEAVSVILRWTGKAWTQVPGPAGRQLRAVAGDAANDGWAVGDDGKATTILHWNGKVWR
jgi:hypothetical protein